MCEAPALASIDAAAPRCHVCYCEKATWQVVCKGNCTPTVWQKLSCRPKR